MKKIVALVLSLVMVLGLATTAMAAPDTYDMYETTIANYAAGKLTATATAFRTGYTVDKVPAVQNADGSGNLEYYNVNNNGLYFVKTTAPTIADYAITAAGKTDILFYLAQVSEEEVKYVAEASAFTSFGQSCGQIYQVDKDIEYVMISKSSEVAVEKFGVYAVNADFAGDYSVLVGGEIVSVDAPKLAENTVLTVDGLLGHKWAVTGVKADTTGKTQPTEVKCLNCGAVVTKFYDAATKVPAGSIPTKVDGYDYWFVAPLAGATTTPVVDGDKVESAETFDAGIAMYVGMSVMAAAGSAVVLKKKD